MPDVETRLGLRAASLSDVADAFTAIDNLRDDAQFYLERLVDLQRDGANSEGCVGPTDGTLIRLSANSIRVVAGSAWIDADSSTIAGLNGAAGYARTGRYRVSWPQTDLTVASTGTNKRLDRVVVPVAMHGSSVTPVLVAGAEAATVDHDAQQSAGALPAGRLQLATVISSTTGVSSTNDASNGFRDRRLNCRGFYNAFYASQFGSNYTNATATPTSLIGGMRVEAHGDLRDIRVRFTGKLSISATGVYAVGLFADTVTPGTMAQVSAQARDASLTGTFAEHPDLEFKIAAPTQRSILLDVRAWVVSGGGTLTLERVSPSVESILEAWETSSPRFSNGAV
jgi:hypothetical protein